MPRPIELLAPARTPEIGIEAITHGADAVYIGGPSFGARAAAGNSVDDIARLCDHAHLYGAKVYVTANTILMDGELAEAERQAWQLYRAGVDALIVQDLAYLKLNLPPIELHASTQMDNRTPEKAQWLESLGFRQIVVARELSLDDITRIHRTTSLPIEAFVHGALCVSYSGRCYASQHLFGRSANRGECAQFCRLAFDLVDARGRVIREGKHLLSLRDMNRSASLEAMMEAGVSSFKIEGRLKDAAYVKNVTAAYRRQIDDIIARRPQDFCRSSYGETSLTFRPDPAKSFNRGFTEYFLHQRTPDVHSFDTPGWVGQPVATVSRTDANSLHVRPLDPTVPLAFANGDGLSYFTARGQLKGFRVNRAEGLRLFPATMPQELPRGATLYRNNDEAFEKLLARPSATRTIPLRIRLSESPDGYRLSMTDAAGRRAELEVSAEKQPAKTPSHDAIRRTLGKLGGTAFSATEIALDLPSAPYIPPSHLAEWRRDCLALLMQQPFPQSNTAAPAATATPLAQLPEPDEEYTANVSNRLSRQVYAEAGAAEIAPAYELAPPPDARLMECRHCLRYALGHCPRSHREPAPWIEPLFLRLPGGKKFPLRFDCAACRMWVLTPEL